MKNGMGSCFFRLLAVLTLLGSLWACDGGGGDPVDGAGTPDAGDLIQADLAGEDIPSTGDVLTPDGLAADTLPSPDVLESDNMDQELAADATISPLRASGAERGDLWQLFPR